MDIGIVGLPRSGKTTIFNAVTRGRAEVATYSAVAGKPNVGVAKVPDHRLDRLAEVFKPRRTVPAQVSYLDVPVPSEGLPSTRGIAGEFLNQLQNTDALLVVARSFEEPAVADAEEGMDAARDVEAVLMELSFSDLEILERRLGRLGTDLKGAKAPEREAVEREQGLLLRLKEGIEAGTPIRDQGLGGDEARLIAGFQLLTEKPVIIVANVGEDRLPEAGDVEAELSKAFDGPGVRTGALCGKLEMELAQMDREDEQELREGLGAGESGLVRMISLSHEVADLVTFFTGNDNEVRAWTVARGSTALEAAGKVHSDFERGFIRAEVIGSDELVESGSVAEARRRGVLRREGRTYAVEDGDVLNILFNV